MKKPDMPYPTRGGSYVVKNGALALAAHHYPQLPAAAEIMDSATSVADDEPAAATLTTVAAKKKR